MSALRAAGFVLATGLIAAAGCVDLEGAYQDCLTDGRCGAVEDSGEDGSTPSPDAGHDGGAAFMDSGSVEVEVDAGASDGGIDLPDAGPAFNCPCPAGTVCPFNANISVNLNAVFAAGPDDVWVTGEQWATAHLVRGGVTGETPNPGTPATSWSITGPSADEIWQFGFQKFARVRTNGTWKELPLRSGLQDNGETGYAGEGNIVLAFGGSPKKLWARDGGAWVEQQAPSFSGNIFSFCGLGQVVYAVGAFGGVFRYNGADAFEALPCSGCPNFYDCALREDGLWLAGHDSTTAVVGQLDDAGTFARSHSIIDGGIYWGLWSDGESELWAVGTSGRISRRVGAQWRDVDAGSTSELRDVSGYRDAGVLQVWAVGTGGTVLQYCE